VKKTIYTSACALILILALTGCEGTLTPSSPPPSASPSPSLSPTPPSTLIREPIPAPFREESPEELKRALAATATPTPSLFPATFPDLTPPPGGWIAFRTPEEHLALISPDGSRLVELTEQGRLSRFTWSPDGRWLAFTVNLGGSTGGQLALVSIEDSRLIPLTRPGTTASWAGLTWSQDSRSLAYFYYTSPEKEIDRVPARSPLALRLFDLSTHQVVTLTTYSNARPDNIASLCSQAFPFPFLPVEVGCFQGSSLQIWDTRAEEMVVELGVGSYYSCKHLWSPEGQGIVFLKVELEKEGIKMEDIQDPIIHPVSLAWWGVGDEAPVVLLEGMKKQSYFPVCWLPDGRLVVRVTHWEKEKYEQPTQPERVEYRFFYVSEEGELREAAGSNLPWWAAGGFQERLSEAHLPQSISPAISSLSGWEVGPDGETVVFTWRWLVDEESKSAIYLWRGEGEPMRLSMGECPQWQLEVTSLYPNALSPLGFPSLVQHL
jgi:hypothetical protein